MGLWSQGNKYAQVQKQEVFKLADDWGADSPKNDSFALQGMTTPCPHTSLPENDSELIMKEPGSETGF